MKTTKELVDDIEKSGWASDVTKHEPTDLYGFWKACEGDVDVIVAIKSANGEYLVLSSAEHRYSGPNDSVHGTASTIERALEIAKKSCAMWDEPLEKVNLSNLKLIP